MGPDSLTWIIVIIVLAAFSALFKAMAAAFSDLSDYRVKELEEERGGQYTALSKISESPDKEILHANALATFTDVVLTIVAAIWAIPELNKLFLQKEFGQINEAFPLILAALVAGLALILLMLVLIRSTALLMIRRSPERFAAKTLWIYRIFNTVFWPLNAILDLLSRLMMSIFGAKLHDESADVTEEEIRMMVDEGELEDTEKEMINNVFEFDDTSASEVMTHRTDITAVDADEASLQDVLDIAIENGYSRIPVYEEDIDNIIGIIYAKDLLRLAGKEMTVAFHARDYMRPALYVPESNHCRDLFRLFKEKKMQMAVVVDEYGGTSGIVTMEDILESIVGNIQDEYDNEEEEVSQVDDDTYTFDGAIALDDVAKLLDIEIDEEIDYDTLGGFLTHLLGRIPDEGETPDVVYENITFHVTLVEDRRIAKVVAKRMPITETEEE